jgi:hypothetical protein
MFVEQLYYLLLNVILLSLHQDHRIRELETAHSQRYASYKILIGIMLMEKQDSSLAKSRETERLLVR